MATARIGNVSVVARKDVDVIVPDVLIPGRFVVLAGGRAVAPVALLERNGNLPHTLVHMNTDIRRQVVQVLDMPVRNDDDRARIVRPPAGVYERGDVPGAPEHVGGLGPG